MAIARTVAVVLVVVVVSVSLSPLGSRLGLLVQWLVRKPALPRRLAHVDAGGGRMGTGGEREVDADPLPVNVHPRALVFGCARVLRVLVVHEAEAPRPPSLGVVDQLQADRAELGEDLAHLALGRVHAQAEHAQDTGRRGVQLEGRERRIKGQLMENNYNLMHLSSSSTLVRPCPTLAPLTRISVLFSFSLSFSPDIEDD